MILLVGLSIIYAAGELAERRYGRPYQTLHSVRNLVWLDLLLLAAVVFLVGYVGVPVISSIWVLLLFLLAVANVYWIYEIWAWNRPGPADPNGPPPGWVPPSPDLPSGPPRYRGNSFWRDYGHNGIMFVHKDDL